MTKTEISSTKIDIVYTYVDGNDPKFLNNLNKYKNHGLGKKLTTNNPKLRYESLDEILYSLRSVFKFASFVNKVFIVTYDQKPKYESTIEKYFPERIDDIKIVDHKDLFGEYPEIYPTFNSESIETFLWKIPDLSENFVYFNDDLLLLRHIKVEDWFSNKGPVNLGKWKLGKIFKYNKFKKRIEKGLDIPLNYTYRQYRGARFFGYKYVFLYLGHCPRAFSKSILKELFEANKETILKNAAHRFRVANSFSIISYFVAGQLKFTKTLPKFEKELYIDFSNKKSSYLKKKIQLLKNNTSKKYLCLQSLSNANESIIQLVESILEEKLN
ncbi:MAG: Stealth CR1 domain-containing protein [Flavobacteriaceae bacterium]